MVDLIRETQMCAEVKLDLEKVCVYSFIFLIFPSPVSFFVVCTRYAHLPHFQ